MEKIEHYEYDFTPTENNEILLVFKVDGTNCEMKIPQKDLARMLWIVNNNKKSY